MIETILCLPLAYLVGWIVATLVLANNWISDTPYPKSFDYVAGGVWGMMGATIWPLLLVGFLVGKLAGSSNDD